MSDKFIINTGNIIRTPLEYLLENPIERFQEGVSITAPFGNDHVRQLNRILSIKLKGKDLFSLNTNEDQENFLRLLSLFALYDLPELEQFLDEKVPNVASVMDLIFEGKNYAQSKKFDFDSLSEDILRDKLLSGSICKVCKSTNTYTTYGQTRSADEGQTTFTYCEDCGNRTRKNT